MPLEQTNVNLGFKKHNSVLEWKLIQVGNTGVS